LVLSVNLICFSSRQKVALLCGAPKAPGRKLVSANKTNAVAEYMAIMLLRFFVFCGSILHINHSFTMNDATIAWTGTQDNFYTASSTASHYLEWNRSAEGSRSPHRTVTTVHQAHPPNARPAIMGHARLNGGR